MALMEKTIWEATTKYEVHIPMSYEAFLTELNEDVHAEWVNGETIIFMPPKPDHQRVVRFLSQLLGLFIEHFQLGELFFAPIEMKPTPDSNAREPDILFVAQENLHIISNTKLEGPANLVIEVISPESLKRDLDDKRREYEAEGVDEYWIIDSRPGKNTAEFHVLNELGRYRKVEPNPEGIFYSTILPNFYLNVNWLWASPVPNTMELFAEIAGLPETVIELLRKSRQR